MRRAVAAAIVALIALPGSAAAHRLDEYLQAARVSMAADAVRVELDLSPGVAIAEAVIGVIDANRDGRVDDAEGGAYAAGVLRDVRLEVDGRSVPLHLENREYPPLAAMREGVGTIRLVASARIAQVAGRHRLTLMNDYEPAMSVYLANALISSDRRVTLGAQQRDELQRRFTLHYDVAGTRTWLGWSGAALAMVGFLVAGRRRSRRSV